MQPVVFVVDDDPSVRKSLHRLLTVYGFQVRTFDSAQAFLNGDHTDTPSCLVLDVRLPGLDGLELQNILAGQRSILPIVFITGHGDIPMSVRAMKAGAVDFLAKPFSEDALLNAVEQAIEKSQKQSVIEADVSSICRRIALLTPRESEVLQHVTEGKMNKQIAAAMGVTEKTVKVHRGRVMQKLHTRSVAELVRMMEKVKRSGNSDAWLRHSQAPPRKKS